MNGDVKSKSLEESLDGINMKKSPYNRVFLFYLLQLTIVCLLRKIATEQLRNRLLFCIDLASTLWLRQVSAKRVFTPLLGAAGHRTGEGSEN